MHTPRKSFSNRRSNFLQMQLQKIVSDLYEYWLEALFLVFLMAILVQASLGLFS